MQDRFPQYYHYFQRRNFGYAGKTYRNHNRLLGRVTGVDGIKTGFIRASGFNLMTNANANGRHIVTGGDGRQVSARIATASSSAWSSAGCRAPMPARAARR